MAVNSGDATCDFVDLPPPPPSVLISLDPTFWTRLPVPTTISTEKHKLPAHRDPFPAPRARLRPKLDV